MTNVDKIKYLEYKRRMVPFQDRIGDLKDLRLAQINETREIDAQIAKLMEG